MPIACSIIARTTDTIEDFHDSEVDAKVLDALESDAYYLRKVLLARMSEGGAV